jgi:hypothetical protein
MLFLLSGILPAAAEQGVSLRVRFQPGTSGATIEGAVLRGTRDRYYLEARRGQRMHVRITSIEDNAVFTVYRKAGGKRLAPLEARSWQGVLPSSGDYIIEVGGTRGNATYVMRVTIR